MSKKKFSIWFWQQMFTPHMGALAEALAERGFNVFFIANQVLSEERLKQGWKAFVFKKTKFIIASNKEVVEKIASKAFKNSIHFTEGLRANGLIKNAQYILRNRRLKHFVIIETIDETIWNILFKRIIYRLLFLYWGNYLSGVLAIGQNARSWIIERGMEQNRVYSFAYFLKKPKNNYSLKIFKEKKKLPFIFIYVGSLIRLKRVNYLISAISRLKFEEIELWIVGKGPEENYLRSMADFLLPEKVRWFGVVSASKVSKIIGQCDCLVLPSRYDGWGAVVSESLMIGTPVVCSDACGSCAVVKASGVGGIFPVNNQKVLVNILRKQYKLGKLNLKDRQKIERWSKCIDSNAGAEYLDLIINNSEETLIKLPWEKNKKHLNQ